MNANGIALKGIGDIINVILVIIIACALYLLLQGKFGSLEMIILPVFIPVVRINWINDFAIYTNYHKSLGHVINSFTEFNPFYVYLDKCDIFTTNGYANFSSCYCYSY